jgi:hypothetical protein
MPSVRIWTPESDYDRDAVVCIAEKIVGYNELDLAIQSASKQGFNDVASKPNGLQKAVNTYLKRNDLVIFLIDADGNQALDKRKREKNSLVNRIEAVVKASEGKAKLILMLQELEAWLLVDCLGICCYFTGNSQDRNQKKWEQFAKKKQKGKTNLIEEANVGGKGAKEYLVELSKEILIEKNPKLKNKPKNLKQSQYSEDKSPKVAECLEINSQTIKRNDSLEEFAKCLNETTGVN